MNTPDGLPDRIWVVTRLGGERHFIDKPPDEGIESWAKGLDVTITEYRFHAVVHTPPKKKETKK